MDENLRIVVEVVRELRVRIDAAKDLAAEGRLMREPFKSNLESVLTNIVDFAHTRGVPGPVIAALLRTVLCEPASTPQVH